MTPFNLIEVLTLVIDIASRRLVFKKKRAILRDMTDITSLLQGSPVFTPQGNNNRLVLANNYCVSPTAVGTKEVHLLNQVFLCTLRCAPRLQNEHPAVTKIIEWAPTVRIRTFTKARA